ncbi:hypothetical protein GW17_00038971 [Ensete ventricosum]|nr:hypothetical protein GW17_00038971 [Ensete ventricosum]
MELLRRGRSGLPLLRMASPFSTQQAVDPAAASPNLQDLSDLRINKEATQVSPFLLFASPLRRTITICFAFISFFASILKQSSNFDKCTKIKVQKRAKFGLFLVTIREGQVSHVVPSRLHVVREMWACRLIGNCSVYFSFFVFRPAVAMIEDAEKNGLITPGKVITICFMSILSDPLHLIQLWLN